jgi:hypothetical protein
VVRKSAVRKDVRVRLPAIPVLEKNRCQADGTSSCDHPQVGRSERNRTRDRSEYLGAVMNSRSAAGALRILGLVPAGGNYIALYDRIREYALDTSHWLGQGHLKGQTNPYTPKIPLEKILVRNSSYRGGTSLLRSRLVRAGIFADRCSACGLSEWRQRRIALHLDHANGERFDNRPENLRLLCPNCHSQTETYCGRNKRLKAGRCLV